MPLDRNQGRSTSKKTRNQSLSFERRPRVSIDLDEQRLAPGSGEEQKVIHIIKENRSLKEEIARRWDMLVQSDQEVQSEALRNGQEIETKPSKFNVNERVFNFAIKNHVDDIECLDNLQVYWDKPWGANVTLKLVSTRYQYQHISALIQFCTNRVFGIQNQLRLGDCIPVFEIFKIQVPKNFIRKLVGYQEKSLQYFRLNPEYNVDFYYDEKLLVDEIFQMNDFTQLRIFGLRRDVQKISKQLLKDLESIKMKSILVQRIDCNFVMNNVKEIKSLVDPCEVRIKQSDGIWKDLRHPFLFLPNRLRDIILIGTSDEIQNAETSLLQYLKQKREKEKYMMNQQLSFLLPIFLKDKIDLFKTHLRRKFSSIQVFNYLPTFPRKHMTISMIGPWNLILEAKQMLEQISKEEISSSYQTYENFQRTVFHQQIRFAFKSLKRYILEKDIKYLSHWDIVSVFLDNIGRDYPFRSEDYDIEFLLKQAQ